MAREPLHAPNRVDTAEQPVASPVRSLSPAAGLRLPKPEPGRRAAEAFVATHLAGLLERRGTGANSSPVQRGGQQAADAALAGFSVEGFRARRYDAYPQARRSTSALSPYLRHGLLSIARVLEHVEGGPGPDVEAFRHALLHHEYSRHWYARLGPASRHGLDRSARTAGSATEGNSGDDSDGGQQWDRRMGCVEITLGELEDDGWLVGETRRWLAATWPTSADLPWREGEDHLFRHLLDGSRAANRLGWQTATGLTGDQAQVFSRWDVERHAPGLCATCELVHQCPVEDGAARIEAELGLTASTVQPGHNGSDNHSGEDPGSSRHPLLDADDNLPRTTGPLTSEDDGRAEAVWITVESMGDGDPALAAHPGLPAVFVFDQPLLQRLRLSPKRLAFWVETLADLATRRSVEVWLGDPVQALADRPLAATFTPVPGWRRRSSQLDVAAVHPWSWFYRPHNGSISSYLEWLGDVEVRDEVALTGRSLG